MDEKEDRRTFLRLFCAAISGTMANPEFSHYSEKEMVSIAFRVASAAQDEMDDMYDGDILEDTNAGS